jgi:DNA helicase HerA-like ATPase
MAKFGLRLEELPTHILILGKSGAGKSNLITLIVLGLLRFCDRVKFWCFDFVREYRKILGLVKETGLVVVPWYELRFNPLRPAKGSFPVTWAQVFAEAYSHSFKVLTGSKSFMHGSLCSLYEIYGVYDGGETYPTIPDLELYLESLKREKSIAPYLPVNLTRLKSICKSLGGVVGVDRGFVQELLDYNVVFELDGIGEAELQNFLVELLMTYAFKSRMASAEDSDKNLLIMVCDEGYRIFDRTKENTAAGIPNIDVLTAQSRHANIGLVVASQEVTKLTNSLLSNTSLKIIFSLASGRDEWEIATSVGLDQSQREFSKTMKTGQAIVSRRGQKPFIAEFPLAI